MKKFLLKIIKVLLEIITMPIVVLLCFLFRFFPKKVDVGMGPLPMISYMYWAKALKRKGEGYNPYCEDIKAVDLCHMFHIGPIWFEKMMNDKWDKECHYSDRYNNHFYAFRKKIVKECCKDGI